MAGEANVWNPRTLIALSGDTKAIEEKITAIANQTLFTLKNFAYVVGTGALEVHRNGLLLTKDTDWVEQTDQTFSLVQPSIVADQIVASGRIAIEGTVDVRDTDIFVSNYQAIRDYTGTELSLYAQSQVVNGDFGDGFYNKQTGAAPGTFVDNNVDVIVPTGGNGSIGWIRTEDDVKYFGTVAEAKAYKRLKLGSRVRIGERENALFEAVDTSGVTPNTFNLIVSTAVAALTLSLAIFGVTITGEFGALNSTGVQIAAEYAKDNNHRLHMSAGSHVYGTALDLTSPGFGAPGFRNITVTADKDATFSAVLASGNIIDISGQRRFRWDGGTFLFGNEMFFQSDASSTAPTASSFMTNITFAPVSSGDIGRCYKADTSIGVFWSNCIFGTDLASNAIDYAVEFTGASSNETNINIFKNCTFRGLTNGAVLLAASGFNRTVVDFDTCWFEDINGPVLEANAVSRSVVFNNCYFEATGSATKASIIVQGGAAVTINGGFISGNQNNATAFANCNAGGELITDGKVAYISVGGRKFLDITNPTPSTNRLEGVAVLGTGSELYEDLLFGGSAFLQYVDYKNPRITSTLATTSRTSSHTMNVSANGFITHRTDTVNIATQGTDFVVATINIPNAAHACRLSVDIFQTIQGVGGAGRSSEWALWWNAGTPAWEFTAGRDLIAGPGWLITLLSVDINTVTVNLQRSTGGATNSPVRVAVGIWQGSVAMEGNEITIT